MMGSLRSWEAAYTKLSRSWLIRSNSKFFSTSSSSAFLWSSMSVQVPNHLIIKPSALRIGTVRSRNQRYDPSNAAFQRHSATNVFPKVNASSASGSSGNESNK